jgi:hypothetical protein
VILVSLNSPSIWLLRPWAHGLALHQILLRPTPGRFHGVDLGGGLVAGGVEGEPGSDGDSGVDGALGPNDAVDVGVDGEVEMALVDGDALETLGVFGGVGRGPDEVAGRREGVVGGAVEGAGSGTCWGALADVGVRGRAVAARVGAGEEPVVGATYPGGGWLAGWSGLWVMTPAAAAMPASAAMSAAAAAIVRDRRGRR